MSRRSQISPHIMWSAVAEPSGDTALARSMTPHSLHPPARSKAPSTFHSAGALHIGLMSVGASKYAPTIRESSQPPTRSAAGSEAEGRLPYGRDRSSGRSVRRNQIRSHHPGKFDCNALRSTANRQVRPTFGQGPWEAELRPTSRREAVCPVVETTTAGAAGRSFMVTSGRRTRRMIG